MQDLNWQIKYMAIYFSKGLVPSSFDFMKFMFSVKRTPICSAFPFLFFFAPMFVNAIQASFASFLK